MSRRALLGVGTLWLVLLALAIALSVLAAVHDTLPGDRGIMDWAEGRVFPGETLSDAVRAITSTEVVLSTGAAVALVLWLRGWRRTAVLLAIALVLLPLMEAGLKELVDRPRPDPALVDLRASFSSASFPSGHVTSSAFLYGFLVYLSLVLPLAVAARWALAAAAAAVFLLSGPVNVYLGVHWPSDVLGGYVWGTLLLIPLLVADRSPGPR